MSALGTPRRRLVALLLVVGAALFAIGTAAERSSAGGHTESAAEHAAEPGTGEATSAGDVHAEGEAGDVHAEGEAGAEVHADGDAGGDVHAEGGAGTDVHTEGEAAGAASADADAGVAERAHVDSEKVFGLDLESIPLVIAAVVVSLLLAAFVVGRRVAVVLLAAAAFAAVFAALDIAEAVHQNREGRGGLTVLAIVIAMVHAAAALVAIAALERRHDRSVGAAIQPT